MQSTLVKPAALTDWAYLTIKEDILNLRHPPGVQLRVEALAEQMQISRTPVREALLKLQSDGLLRSIPRVGFFVTEITEQDLHELFEIRVLLESHVVAKAAPRLTDEDLARIDELIKHSIEATKEQDLVKFLDTDIALHGLLLERAGNRHLIDMMETIRDLTFRERALSIRSSQNVSETLKEHQKLVGALHKRDGELASRLMREHLLGVNDRVLEVFRSAPEKVSSSS